MQRERGSTTRVGILVLLAIAVFAFGIFMIGDQSNLFRAKQRYEVRFVSVGGLQEGNPVQLNGVLVGTVEGILLPEDPNETGLIITIAIDARYRERIRADSEARIKTLGLLGDKFIELTSGSLEAAELPDGGEIPTAEATDVDQLIASGEDVVQNIVSISVSLKQILERMERGEGLLGELMRERTGDQPGLAETLVTVNEAVGALTDGLRGDGPLPRMLHDEAMGQQVAEMIARFDRITAELENPEGTLMSLLRDEGLKTRLDQSVANFETASEKLANAATQLESGDGLLPRLLNDEALAESLTGELQSLLERLNSLATKMTEGDGTVAKLLDDPSIYEALNDVVVGIDESKLLRWLIRNRQKKGIKKRYRDEKAELEAAGETVPPLEDPGTSVDPGPLDDRDVER